MAKCEQGGEEVIALTSREEEVLDPDEGLVVVPPPSPTAREDRGEASQREVSASTEEPADSSDEAIGGARDAVVEAEAVVPGSVQVAVQGQAAVEACLKICYFSFSTVLRDTGLAKKMKFVVKIVNHTDQGHVTQNLDSS